MAEIKPFRGIRFNQNKIKIKEVVAPPYDVISSEEQDNLYKKNEANIIRLILGKECQNDTKINNKYTRASSFFTNWEQEKILIKDREEALYIYSQDFEFDGISYSRTGFLSLLKQEPLFEGTIYPHERTLSKPKADRLNLMRTCDANFSPIFALYNDETQIIKKIIDEIMQKTPEINFYNNNERNRLWLLTNEDQIKCIQNTLKDKKIFIADGHHRYETSMNYAKEMRDQKKIGNFDYVMTFLCDMNDKGLTVFPTHRVVQYKNLDIQKFLNKIEKYFNIQKIEKNDLKQKLEKEFEKSNIAFGLYTGEDYLILLLKDKEGLADLIQGSKYYRELDVAVLEALIFEKVLSFSKEDIALQKHLKYIKDLNDAINMIDSKSFNMAFIMNPTRLDQIKNVALAGETMPQKSTYFYPKLLTGIVINKFEAQK
ncbi:DUF1015 domain-containing protein [bacterium]